jgi:anti-sigma factor RsiW
MTMTNDCGRLRPRIPAYLDGELGEDEARTLRRHLLDCQSCRTATQGQRALSRWFEAEPAPAVPPGFAARVARRAFAGDPGQTGEVPAAPAPERSGLLLQFVLRVTAAAAVLLIVLAGLLRNSDLPTGDDLRAEDETPATLEELLRELDELDRATPEAATPAAVEEGRDE